MTDLDHNPNPSQISNSECTWATIVHLSALTGLVFPLLIILAPLIVWLMKRKEMPFVDEQGKEAVNFQLTMLIGFVICIPLMFILIGFVFAAILGLLDLIFIIIAAINANDGKHYRYPFRFEFIK